MLGMLASMGGGGGGMSASGSNELTTTTTATSGVRDTAFGSGTWNVGTMAGSGDSMGMYLLIAVAGLALLMMVRK